MSIDKLTGIWDLDTAKRRHQFDLNLGVEIAQMFFAPKRAADLGCGLGNYCALFKAMGWPNVDGYEGTPRIQQIAAYDNVMPLNLTLRRWVGIDYDFVMSLEVGEHIPKQFEQVFINNVCEFAQKDLVLSWGIPGQGGKGHFNEQPNEYVVNEFKKRGFRLERKKSKALREVATKKWFRNTLLCFKKG